MIPTSKRKQYINALNFAWKLTLFVLKLCEKNSFVNIRFKIFVMAFRARRLFGAFEKRAHGTIHLVNRDKVKYTFLSLGNNTMAETSI